MRKKQSTFVLKRAFLPAGQNTSLEGVIRQIKINKPNYMERNFERDMFSAYYITKIAIDSKRPAGVFAWLSLQDTGSTGVMSTAKEELSGDVEEFDVPKNKAWIQKEILLYVSGNHIIACGLGSRDKLVADLLKEISVKAGVVEDEFSLHISDVPNTPEIERINREGVRHIDVNVTSYLADLEVLPFSSEQKSLLDPLLAILGKPPAGSDLSMRAAATGKIVLSRGAWSKEEVLKKDLWLTHVGESVVNSQLDDYTIVLEDGSKVSTNKIKVSKACRIKQHANTFDRNHAELLISTYYDELKNNGSLEW